MRLAIAPSRHVIARKGEDGWTVAFYALDGAKVADLTGTFAAPVDGQSSANVRVSGQRLMVTCSDDGQVWLFDTATGDQIDTWIYGEGAVLRAFDYPE